MLCYCGHPIHPGYQCKHEGSERCPCIVSQTAPVPAGPVARRAVTGVGPEHLITVAEAFELNRLEALGAIV